MNAWRLTAVRVGSPEERLKLLIYYADCASISLLIPPFHH